METEDLTPALQEMMTQLAQVRAELNELKVRTEALPQQGPMQPVKAQPITSTRRKTLKRLGLALLGGVATATALGEASTVQAKVVAHPQGNGFANRVGMLILPPGAAAPTGTLGGINTYGLIVSSDTAPLNFPLTFVGNVGILATSADGNGVSAISTTGNGVSAISTEGYGVVGQSSSGAGVYGYSTDGNGGYFYSGGSVGAIGNSGGTSTGNTVPTSAVGLLGNAGTNLSLSAINSDYNIGVYGIAAGNVHNYAGFFQGNVYVTGTLSKGGGSFKIDHPTDPENKYLYHSFVESPDMMNIYSGLATLDEQGEAVVEMPGWFEALNSDFRYQLTCMDRFTPVFVSERIKDRKFKIAGGLQGQEISWMVTGIRQDAWAKANRIAVEEDKTGDAKGTYLHPELFK